MKKYKIIKMKCYELKNYTSNSKNMLNYMDENVCETYFLYSQKHAGCHSIM